VPEGHGRSLDMLEGDDWAADLLVQEQLVLASCYGASAADRQLRLMITRASRGIFTVETRSEPWAERSRHS
jgi:hypothetical protein